MLRYVFACGRGAARLLISFRREDGYAIVLTLIALPFILGLSLLVIDASRVTNLHTDLQNAVDSLALAGARELDGRNDAIDRAKAAIAAVNSNQAWFGGGGAGLNFGSKLNVTYVPGDDAGSTVQVYFIAAGDLPVSDETPLTLAMTLDETDEDASNEAAYVWVVAKSASLQTMFPLPGGGRDTVTLTGGANARAQAVATYTASACDVTPLFICNPFETGAKTFNEAFEDGDLYGTQFEFRNTGASSVGPGNFGFLRTYGTGASVLADALGRGGSGVCYRQRGLDTQPGAVVGPVVQGINTRFGIYGGSFGNEDDNPDFAPDVNVRKGQAGKVTGAKTTFDCAKYDPEPNTHAAMAFPDGGSPVTLPGGVMTNNNWDLNKYWYISHGGLTVPPPVGYSFPTAPSAVTSYMPSLPPTSTSTPPRPSRYDVYQYEIANNLVNDAAPNKENGLANNVIGPGAKMCYKSPSAPAANRRLIFSAVVNCVENEDKLQGAGTDIPAEAYARMFMTKPATAGGGDNSIYLEFVDVTGKGGLGTVEDYLREEAELVR